MGYKKIKKILFPFRVRKDKLQVSLQLNEGKRFLRSFYVEENQAVHYPTEKFYQTIDRNGDFTLWFYITEHYHAPKHCYWTDVKTLFSNEISNAELKDCIMIYKVILDKYTEIVGEKKAESLGLLFEAFKKMQYEDCKREYIAKLQAYISGKRYIVTDAAYTPMKKELLEEELQTLAHFVAKPSDTILSKLSEKEIEQKSLTVNLSNFHYYCHSIHPTKFGGKRLPSPMDSIYTPRPPRPLFEWNPEGIEDAIKEAEEHHKDDSSHKPIHSA